MARRSPPAWVPRRLVLGGEAREVAGVIREGVVIIVIIV